MTSNSKHDQKLELPEGVTEDQFLSSLKARAASLGITHSPNIGLVALKAKIDEFQAAKEAEELAKAASFSAEEDEQRRKNEERQKQIKEQTKLIRIRVVSMDSEDKEKDGEMFTAGNSVVGMHTRFVKFGVPWHVENILYESIKGRMFNSFSTKKLNHNIITSKPRLIPKYSIELLPPLTEKEIKDLATAQAAANRIGDED